MLKEDVGVLKKDVGLLKEDVGTLKTDVAELKVKVDNLESQAKANFQMVKDLDLKISERIDGFDETCKTSKTLVKEFFELRERFNAQDRINKMWAKATLELGAIA